MTEGPARTGEAIWLGSVGSTNSYLKGLARSGAREWTAVVADSQSEGRGRLGRSWFSDGPWGLWASVLLRPGIPPERVPLLGIMAALAAARSIRALAGIDAGIKWPNDVECGGLKLCGVLPEAGFGPRGLEWVVIGVGMNLSDPPSPFPVDITDGASTVERLSGRRVARREMMGRLLAELADLYDGLMSDGGKALLEEAESLSTVSGRNITVRTQAGTYSARAVGMDGNGALVVEDALGERRALVSGEVSIRRW